MMRITNTAPGPRGVHSVTGTVYLAPGQTIDIEVSDAEVPGILAHPDLVAEVADPAPPAHKTRRQAKR